MPGIKLFRNHKGFTLIEIIAVLVIVGILSIFAANRITIDNTDLLSTQAALKTHIRYAQSKAMQRANTVWGIRFDAGLDEYWIFQCNTGDNCEWTTNIELPFGAEASPTNSNNDRIQTSQVNVGISPITVDNTAQARFTLIFDDMGVPFWLAGTAITFLDPIEDSAGINRLTDDVIIRLTDAAANSQIITVTGETGFIR